jgi:acyl-coenzyme A synthetase/AMP-(fatty) acid ligase/acyl carrier protein
MRDRALHRTSPHLPVGRPIPDRKLTIVAAEDRPAAVGETGEIVVASRHIAIGYWRDPALTAQAFGTDPADPHARVYRTGDLARWRPDGLIEFVGRKDAQIKLAGHRIEPAEVESALMACTGVREAAVVVRRSEADIARALAAYVTLQPGIRGLLPRHLTVMLKQRLPGHMIPAAIFIVDDFPRLASLKIDRVRLAELDAAQGTAADERIHGSMVDQVATVFERVLGVRAATSEDSLSSLGGDSLQAVEIAAELERRFAVPLPVETFNAAQSIGELARWIAAQHAPLPSDEAR